MESITTSGLIRHGKILVVLFAGVFGALVVFGNLTDYSTNYLFVQHTLSMDTIFPDSSLLYRAITNPILHHIFYGLIIALETLFALFCLLGAWQLFRHRHANGDTFHGSKKLAVLGCLIGIGIWYFCFQVVGGEWFAMWQSSQWNALSSAGRFVDYLFAALIFITLPIDD